MNTRQVLFSPVYPGCNVRFNLRGVLYGSVKIIEEPKIHFSLHRFNGMTDPPWEINDNQDEGLATLNRTDRQYCATGEPVGEYSNSALFERVRQDRIKNFHKRIQALIDDILLTYHSEKNFLSTEEWGELWEEITDIESRAEKISDTDILHGPRDNQPHVRFAFELGYMIRVLNHDDRMRSIDLAWGFLLGLRGRDLSEYNRESRHLPEQIEKLEEYYEERHDFAEGKSGLERSKSQIIDEHYEALYEPLENEDLLLDLESIEDERIFTPIYIFCKTDVHGAFPFKQASVQEAYPNLTSEEINKTVQKMVDSDLLYELEDIFIDISRDVKNIERGMKNIDGATAREVLNQLHDRLIEYNEPSVTVNDLGFRSNYQAMMTGTLNRLSAEQKGDLHTVRPTLENKANRWAFTSYGECLSRTICNHEGDPRWLYYYAFDKLVEVIDSALHLSVTDNYDYEYTLSPRVRNSIEDIISEDARFGPVI